ncbi:hypothetical protein DM807_18470 [Pseudomonas hunanensis]|nr:hypothetical protein [Pseudomonas hunanensis]
MQVSGCVICSDIAELTAHMDGYLVVFCRSCGTYQVDDAALWEILTGRKLDVSASRNLLALQRQEECEILWLTIGNAPWLDE